MPTYLDRSSFTGLDSLSCQLVTSAVRCRLATRITLCQLLSPSSFVQLLLPVTSRSRAQAFVWFCAKTDKRVAHIVLHKYPWKRCKLSYPPSYGLRSNTTTLLLQGWFWHLITHENWYAMKQRNQKPDSWIDSFLLLENHCSF